MPLYVDDFLGGTALWTGPERALYALLLILQWASGPLPSGPEKLAKVTGYDLTAFRTVWKTVAGKFEATRDGLVNRRLEEHRAHSLELQSVRSDVGKAGAAARWQRDGKGNGKGNASGISKRNGKRNGKTMPSNSNSNSNSKSNSKSINGINGDIHRPAEPEQMPDLVPSEPAIASALEMKQGITRADLLEEFFRWARSQKDGRWPNVDAAFLGFARKHEPTLAQRQRASTADRKATAGALEHAGNAAARAMAPLRTPR